MASDKQIYTYKKGKKKGDKAKFSSLMTDWSSSDEAREFIVNKIMDDLYEKLVKKECISGYDKGLLTPKQKKQIHKRDKGMVRVQGRCEGVEFRDTPQGKKAEKEFNHDYSQLDEYVYFPLQDILTKRFQGEHLDSKEQGGKNTVDNGELSTAIYNRWKWDKKPDYTFDTRNI